MEPCYTYLGCDKRDCIMYEKNDGTQCWEVGGTLCNNPGLELIVKNKKDKCKYCLYYIASFERNKYL